GGQPPRGLRAPRAAGHGGARARPLAEPARAPPAPRGPRRAPRGRAARPPLARPRARSRAARLDLPPRGAVVRVSELRRPGRPAPYERDRTDEPPRRRPPRRPRPEDTRVQLLRGLRPGDAGRGADPGDERAASREPVRRVEGRRGPGRATVRA